MSVSSTWYDNHLKSEDQLGCIFIPPGTGMNVNVKLLSRVQLFATPWTVAYQAPPSMGLSRQ